MRRADEYDLKGYGEMIADGVRMRAYHDAMAQAITPGAVVLDIGAGTGVLSLLACKLGAGKVYAVEPSDAITMGAELAKANGFGDRIEFIQKTSFDTALPRAADVIVSDLRGALPLFRQHLPSILDARRRLLAPGGTLISQRDAIRVQLVSDAEQHSRTIGIWRQGVFGVDLSPALRWITHQSRKGAFSRSILIGHPETIMELDYRTLESPNAKGQVRWTIEEHQTTAHGLAAWFDASLTASVGFSNAPDEPPTVYGQTFFPFPEPVNLNRGDEVVATLAATLVGNDYVWQWNTSVTDDGHRRKVAFKQSTFQAAPINTSRLATHAAGFVPTISNEGRAAALALTLMQQGLSVGAISEQLEAEFPQLFSARPGSARDLAGELSERFSDR